MKTHYRGPQIIAQVLNTPAPKHVIGDLVTKRGPTLPGTPSLRITIIISVSRSSCDTAWMVAVVFSATSYALGPIGTVLHGSCGCIHGVARLLTFHAKKSLTGGQ